MNLQDQIKQLTKENFQHFLSQNQKTIYVFETKDFEYRYFFPSHLTIKESCQSNARFARQYG